LRPSIHLFNTGTMLFWPTLWFFKKEA